MSGFPARLLAPALAIFASLASCKPSTPTPPPPLPAAPAPLAPRTAAAAPAPTFPFTGTWICDWGAVVISRKGDQYSAAIRIEGWVDPVYPARLASGELEILEKRSPTRFWTLVPVESGRSVDIHNASGTFRAFRIGSEKGDGLPAVLHAIQTKTGSKKGIASFLRHLGKSAKEAIPVILEAMETEDDDDLLNLENVLVPIGPADPPLLQRIQCCLYSSSPRARVAAADVLGAMGPAASPAMPALLRCLGHSDPGIRLSASFALARIGESAIPDLVEFASEENEVASAAAVDALRRMGPSGRRALERLAESAPAPSVRKDARLSLDPTADASSGATASGGFWPGWRGPHRDNISSDRDLLRVWPEGGPPLAWQVQGIGRGIAAPAVRDGRVFVLGYIGEWEFVTALEETSGRRLWATPIDRSVSEAGHMRWLQQRTPTVDRDLLYAFGASGVLVCLRVADGKEQWRKDYVADFACDRAGVWFFVDYPLVDGDRLLCAPGGSKASVVALDKRSGTVLWSTLVPDTRMSCASMILGELRGIRQGIVSLSGGLVGFRPSTGEVLWTETFPVSNSWTPRATPILKSDRLWVSPAYGSPFVPLEMGENGKIVSPDPRRFKKVKPGWLQDSSLVDGNFFYLPADRTLLCVALDSGEVQWEGGLGRRSWGFPAFTEAEGCLYCFTPDGQVFLVEATPDVYRPRSHFQFVKQEDGTSVTNPVIAGGRLYLRSEGDSLYAYDVRNRGPDSSRTKPAPLILRPPVKPPAPGAPLPPAVYVPTPQDVVDRMLMLAKVERDRPLMDLGSGDGRIVITAARRYGALARGVEIDKSLLELSRERAMKAGVRVQFERQDLFTVDLEDIDVVTVYLPPDFLERLLPQFRKLKPGARIVSHEFLIPGIPPDSSERMVSTETGREHSIHVWTAPIGRSGK